MPLFTDPEAGEHAINAMLADILIERLNKLIEDPAVRADISALIETRVPVGAATCVHPTLQVVDSKFLGPLGLINGLVGVIPDGLRQDWGYIAADFDDENKLVKFMRTPMPKEQPQMPIPEKEFKAALKALFTLEGALEPPPTKTPLTSQQRRRIYVVRCEVTALLNQMRTLAKGEDAEPK